MLNISTAFDREPDLMRLGKLDKYIADALRRCEGNSEVALHNLIHLAEKESELGDLVTDVMATAFARHFYRVAGDHLQHQSKSGDTNG
jgi:hypothetical protein